MTSFYITLHCHIFAIAQLSKHSKPIIRVISKIVNIMPCNNNNSCSIYIFNIMHHIFGILCQLLVNNSVLLYYINCLNICAINFITIFAEYMRFTRHAPTAYHLYVNQMWCPTVLKYWEITEKHIS